MHQSSTPTLLKLIRISSDLPNSDCFSSDCKSKNEVPSHCGLAKTGLCDCMHAATCCEHTIPVFSCLSVLHIDNIGSKEGTSEAG